ncbi:hypothetical protein Ciccas_012921 [Cichlidogyrus casuarinus]|uniref:Uncharacterized protein n=1 Tax=Cichlidogyrus casuarinus TaxID=1844966 RepID=A0ABD2PN25_9PLAT
MSLDCGRKPEYPGRTHANTRRTCKPWPDGGIELRPFLLRDNNANHRATVLPGLLNVKGMVGCAEVQCSAEEKPRVVLIFFNQ